MKNWLGNIIIRLILSANKDLKSTLFHSLKSSNWSKIEEKYRTKYSISDSFRFNGKDIKFYGNGKIVCGKNSYIGEYSTIQSYENCKVVIGDNCSISHNVRIYTASNAANQDMNTSYLKEKVVGDVIINDGVWIGANVFIKEDVTIGKNAVVGANSVVTKNIEPNAIYGGIPAKLIRFKDA